MVQNEMGKIDLTLRHSIATEEFSARTKTLKLEFLAEFLTKERFFLAVI